MPSRNEPAQRRRNPSSPPITAWLEKPFRRSTSRIFRSRATLSDKTTAICTIHWLSSKATPTAPPPPLLCPTPPHPLSLPPLRGHPRAPRRRAPPRGAAPPPPPRRPFFFFGGGGGREGGPGGP